MRTTFNRISSIVLIVFFFICLENCNFSMDKGDINYVDCLGDFDLGVFHFTGTNHPTSIEYYENKHDYIVSYGNNVSVTFNDNKTFTLNVKFKCDTLSSVPICDSINFLTGFKELSFKGSWDFEQHSETYGYGSWRSNRVAGECNLNVTESTNDMLNGEKIVCDIHVDCSPDILNHWMDINIPINDDRLQIQMTDEVMR